MAMGRFGAMRPRPDAFYTMAQEIPIKNMRTTASLAAQILKRHIVHTHTLQWLMPNGQLHEVRSCAGTKIKSELFTRFVSEV